MLRFSKRKPGYCQLSKRMISVCLLRSFLLVIWSAFNVLLALFGRKGRGRGRRASQKERERSTTRK
jgi:hypothetical protein